MEEPHATSTTALASTAGIPDWPAIIGADRPRLPLVLLYHSIADASDDPWGVRVSPENFERQMAIIAHHCTPTRLAEMHEKLPGNRLPPRTVVVTFDDGYIDNLLIAKPIMQRLGVPGTVFVASGYVDRAEEFWWDDLERLVLQPGRIARRVTVPIGDKHHQWHIGADFCLPRFRRRFQQWRNRYYAYDISPDAIALQTPRQRMFRPLWELLRSAPSVQAREQALDALRAQSHPFVASRPRNRCCTSAQLREIAEDDLIEIGAHTVDHPSLGFLNRQHQRHELFESRRMLTETIGRPVESFAYPFGEVCDYNADTLHLLAEAGYLRACTNHTEREASMPSVDRFRIPRHIAQNHDADRFVQWLANTFAKYGGGER